MKVEVKQIWEDDLTKAEDYGVYIVAGKNSDGSIGVGEMIKEPDGWKSFITGNPTPNFEPKAFTVIQSPKI